MLRWYMLGGAVVAAGLGWGLYLWENNRHADTRAALDLATDYIETTKETTNALSELPTDPDDVLSQLCAIAPRGESCGDIGSSPAGSAGTRPIPDIQ